MAVKACLREPEGGRAQLRAVAITGQMQDVILLPRDPRQPPPPAILYSDARATAEADEIGRLAGGSEVVTRVTGMRQGPTSLLAKLRWLDRHSPEAFQACWRLLMGGHDYVTGRMCGEWVSDATTASTTGLSQSGAGGYAEELLRQVELSHWLPKLPPLVPPDVPCGRVTREAAQAMEAAELEGLPVFHSCGDAGACTIGCGAGAVGQEYAYVGTSGWVAGSFPRPATTPGGQPGQVAEAAPGVFTLAHPDPDLVFKTGSIMTAGGNVAWAASLLGSESSSFEEKVRQVDEAASSAPAGSGGVLYLPFLQGERCPFEDGGVRAALVGMAADTDRGMVHRAVMEGVAFALRSAREAMAGGDGAAQPLRMGGGGARSPLWPLILAGVFDRTVDVLADSQEVGVKGAAILAGRWLGWHSSLTPEGEWVTAGSSVQASEADVEAYRRLYPIYRQCCTDLRKTYRDLASFRDS